jgi:hypothetical protein
MVILGANSSPGFCPVTTTGFWGGGRIPRYYCLSNAQEQCFPRGRNAALDGITIAGDTRFMGAPLPHVTGFLDPVAPAALAGEADDKALNGSGGQAGGADVEAQWWRGITSRYAVRVIGIRSCRDFIAIIETVTIAVGLSGGFPAFSSFLLLVFLRLPSYKRAEQGFAFPCHLFKSSCSALFPRFQSLLPFFP